MIHRPIDKDSIIKIWQDLGEPYPSTDNLMKIRQLTGYGLCDIKETIVNFVWQKSAILIKDCLDWLTAYEENLFQEDPVDLFIRYLNQKINEKNQNYKGPEVDC